MAKMKKGGYLKTMGKTAPAAVDASMGCKGGSVDKDACRSAVAPNMMPTGPRTA